MKRLVLLLVLGACKESGPTPAQLAEQRQKLCAAAAPTVQRLSAQLEAVQRLDLPPVAADAPSEVRLDFTKGSRTLVQWGGEGTALERCAELVKACDALALKEPLDKCIAYDSVLLVRPRTEEKTQVDEAMLNKYKPGRVTGDAIAFALPADGGTPLQLGAVGFDWRLQGGVEVERQATNAEREQALAQALRKEVLGYVELRLATAEK